MERKCIDCPFCLVGHEQEGEYIYVCNAPGYLGVGQPAIGNKADTEQPMECWFDEAE